MERRNLCLDDGRTLAVKLARHPRARRIKLSLDHRSQELRVTLPPGVAIERGWRFAQDQRGWVADKLALIDEMPSLSPGARIPFEDGERMLVNDPNQVGVHVDDHRIIVGGAPEFFARRLVDYFKQHTKRDLAPRVLAKADQLGKRVARISVRDQKTRWGSCSSTGTLSFSWRIGLAPVYVRDYLAAHEVAHLAEMNHSPRFWVQCDRLCAQGKPQRTAAELWLKREGRTLMALQTNP